jgi:hypothetical protein
MASAGQVCQSWKGSDRKPYLPVAVAGATVCVLAGSAGPVALAAAAVVTTIAALTARQFRFGGRAWDARLTIAIAVLIGAGAAVPALLRGELGVVPALVFLALIHAVDASAFIVGSGASSRWEGPIAGAASAAAIGLAVAALLVPPFRGLSPWILAGVAGLLAPCGVLIASTLVGRAEAPVPALRRLDALLVAGPVWLLAARLLLDL